MGDVGRNLIHNSMFNVAQRGVGPWVGDGSYTADRWVSAANPSSAQTITVAALSDGNRAAIGDEAARQGIQAVVTGYGTAGSYNVLVQRIENVRRLSGKTVTVSLTAWVGSGSFKLGVGFTQSFGTGGAPSTAANVAGQSVTLSTTPTRYSLTFNLPSTSGKTFGTNANDYTEVVIWFSGATDQNSYNGSIGPQSATFVLWGVQLEIGSVATPLEKPDPQVDVANCRRFYNITELGLLQYNTAGGYCNAYGYFPVAMRAFPTLGLVVLGTDSNLATINVTNATAGAVAFIMTVSATATGLVGATRSIIASADL